MAAAIASSAPIQFNAVGPSFFRLVTEAAETMAPGCAMAVRRGFRQLLELSTTAKGLYRLSSTFQLCPDSLSSPAQLEHLILWARNAFVTVAMGNYPYVCVCVCD